MGFQDREHFLDLLVSIGTSGDFSIEQSLTRSVESYPAKAATLFAVKLVSICICGGIPQPSFVLSCAVLFVEMRAKVLPVRHTCDMLTTGEDQLEIDRP